MVHLWEDGGTPLALSPHLVTPLGDSAVPLAVSLRQVPGTPPPKLWAPPKALEAGGFVCLVSGGNVPQMEV